VPGRQSSLYYSRAKDLLSTGHFEDLAQTLSIWISKIQDLGDWNILLELVERVPERDVLNLPRLTFVYIEALAWNHRHNRLLDVTDRILKHYEGEELAQILFFRSTSFLDSNDLPNTLGALETALPHLAGETRGRALANDLGSIVFLRQKSFWIEGLGGLRV
jgi:hypothetical protein